MANNAMTLDDCQEYILYDVLDVIFSHLTINSLRNVALVSRSWNHAAKREIAKRKTLSRVLLPVHYNDEQQSQSKFHLSDYFNAKPNTVLMFCGPQSNMRPVLGLEYKIMEEYYKRLPGRIIMLGVDQAMMDTMEVQGCKLQSFCRSETPTVCNNILGLNLPNSHGFTIKVAECVSHEKNTARKAEKIFKELHEFAEHLDNPVFLLFSRHNYTIGSHVLRMFQEKYANKAVNVWGCTIGDFIKRSDDGYPDYRGTHGFLGILLQAPQLRSYSLVLQFDHDDIMSMKLSDFRYSVELKRHSLGLVCGPRQLSRYDKINNSKKIYQPNDFMKLLKIQFPNVEFTGMFNDPDFYYYGYDHTSKNGYYSLQHKGALSIIILTYS